MLAELWRKLFPKSRKRGSIKASYDLARVNRLTADFLASSQNFDQELRNASLGRLRDRCRELARNDPNAIKFLSLLVKNVVGSEGIQLQSTVMLQRGGRPNKQQNQLVENAWYDWGKKANCTVTTKYSWIQVQNLSLRSCATDGEVFIRKLTRNNNPHRFSLQFIDSDQVDEKYNELLPNGNRVIMGVELNPDGAPVTYHVFNYPVGDYQTLPRQRLRIPASEMIHLYLPTSPFQTRGVPWMVGAALQMFNFKGYQEAELTAARVAACQMGVITKDIDPTAAVDPNKSPDYLGGQPFDVQAGTFAALAPGESMSMFDPKHPVQAYDSYIKAVQRSIAGGLDVSYMSLSGDLEGSSYSSARVGLLDERDTWATLQSWMIESLCEPVYEAWLRMSFLSYMAGASTTVFDYPPTWHPRSFPWVDPQKDAEAEGIKLDRNLTTLTRSLGAIGQDFRETVDEIAEECNYMIEKDIKGLKERAGLVAEAPKPAPKPTAEPAMPKKPSPAMPTNGGWIDQISKSSVI